MTELELLIQQIKKCNICASDLPFAPNPIIQLCQNAKILIIGQAPGKVAHNISKPFLDKSGERLRMWLDVTNEQFYNKDNFAIMPMAFCFPGKNNTNSGDKAPPSICQQTWHNKIREQLGKVELTLLVGQYAAKQYLTEFSNLTNAIKNNEVHKGEVIVLPHPSPRNNIWLSKNKWFETKTLPILRQRIKDILIN
ncbi:IclR family transcriptional regulator [Psychrosphaera saromensis]|uniref:Uracil-DNA glycosylase-like domain-containing protein n=1 Tax=Psychrosphaera saromensis TaxID=716813 RepID=A0A2S7USJ7_9GAMM|nr:uracil-DNA glycosylase family protein [Psychrosphaera saromensis]PQJ52482.1 hypothetical protein BTO11_01680 [Psychrosphaera saromensis]GHB68870.1 IclR family transcriptional regulator [Psychrosphaera saromensis]GLQ12943.1 IclR family transcriptional regulator [Psychrosphaera saromensis]